jgi:hypothetical protein
VDRLEAEHKPFYADDDFTFYKVGGRVYVTPTRAALGKKESTAPVRMPSWVDVMSELCYYLRKRMLEDGKWTHGEWEAWNCGKLIVDKKQRS